MALTASDSGRNRQAETGGRACPGRSRGEDGQYLVILAISLVVVIALLGLVVDGGFLFRGYRQARTVANMAAHAASFQIDEQHFVSTNRVRLDAGKAAAVATDFVAANIRQGMHPVGVTVWADRVSVTVAADVPVVFMCLFGATNISVRATAYARPSWGIEQEGD
jgi:uncharacterized membrane protein